MSLSANHSHQAQYWDKVADHIRESVTPGRALVGYHSPYDLHVRRVVVGLLDRFSSLIKKKDEIAELGSGTGLNLRYFSQFMPQKNFGIRLLFATLDIGKK